METAHIIKQQFGGDAAAFTAHCRQVVKARRMAETARRDVAHGRWHQMMARCYDSGHAAFHNYGGRGIQVCERWHDFTTYFADVGSPPRAGLTLDRRNNDGHYEPGNVRWATYKQQSANRRISKRG